MTVFVHEVKVPAGKVIESALGTGPGNVFQAATDIGKPVTLAASGSHVLAAANAEIEGFVNSVEPNTVNNGFSFGGVLKDGRILAVVGPNQGATPMAVGDYVVADAQSPLGNAGNNQGWTDFPGTRPGHPTGPTALVKTGNPTKFLWRCIRRVTGNGAAGTVVVLERQ